MNNILSQQPLSTSLILQSEQSSHTSFDILEELKDSVQLTQLPLQTDTSEPILQTQSQLQQLEELKQHNFQFIQQIKDLHNTIDELNQTISTQDMQIKQLKTQINKFQLIIQDNNHSTQILKQSISDFEYKIYEQEETINELNDEINKLNSQKIQFQQSIQEYKQQLHSLKQEKTELLLNQSIITLDQLYSQNEQHLQKEIQQLHLDYSYLFEQQEQQEITHQKQISQLKDQCQKQKLQIDQLIQFQQKYNQISEQVNDNKVQIINYENLITKLEDQNRILQDKYSETQKKLSKQQLNTNDIKQKYHNLLLLQENDQAIILQLQNQTTSLKKDLGKFKYQRDSLIEVQAKLMKSQFIEEDTNFKKQNDSRQVEIFSLKEEITNLQNELKHQQVKLYQQQQNFNQFERDATSIIQQLSSEINILYQFEKQYQSLKIENSELVVKLEMNEQQLKIITQQNDQQMIQLQCAKVNQIEHKVQYVQTDYFVKNQIIQTDTEQEIKQINKDKFIDMENTINYIINNLDQLKDIINVNQSNIKDLLHFKQVMSQLIIKQQSDNIQETDYIQESTQLQTPRSIEKKEIHSNQMIETMNSQLYNLEQQLLEKNALLDEKQTEIYELQEQIDIMKMKVTENNFSQLLNDENKQLKQLQYENLELRVKLEAQSEISKENMKLRKRIAQIENLDKQQNQESSGKYIMLQSNKWTVKTQLSNQTNKSIERKRTMNSEYQSYIKQQQHIDNGIGQSKKYIESLKRNIDELNSKLTQYKDTIKFGSNLLNTMLNDLRKKQNIINNEDLTKKKTIIAFIEKLGQQTEFVLRKLNQKNETMSPNKECF